MPPQTQTQRRRKTGNNDNANEARRRRQSRHKHESDDSEASEEDQDGDVDMERTGDADDQLVKKLVRYALACEYARIPIKRDGIRDKVLGSNTRSFKRVFEGAQAQLQQVFGMEMVELPVKEKRTLKEKQRANARKAASHSTASSRQYILVSTLPLEYKSQSIIAPSRIPSTSEEAAYVGFYTMIISLIVLNGGELSDTKLRRYLTRLNASQNLPMDKTDNVLQKIVRQAYVDKVVEKSDGDEDAVTWCIGSRGKVEVPPESIAAVITEVWGELPDDFHTKLQRSLGIQEPQQGYDESAIPEE
ncbi:MAGE-domain-containing protein [Daldinia loculata]|uniref:MAGE-domain-containing protein n=1 Tax=Daldinia loculata TaxID=103429 RepID=UPI0020C5A9E0|nr:MAGE-domain-containing protein [Daldinia loculata]KAI1648881.1 MAGE-domain-containing protein [Daldinia loculata]KAI2770666.1 MAGE-domain-containing protein [Daldinia loculata]